MKNTQTRMIAIGGMLTAIYSLFLLINRSLGGFLDTTIFFLIPLPLMIYSIQYGFKNAFIPFVAMSILTFVFSNPTSIIYLMTANLNGLIAGSLLKVKKDLVLIFIINFLVAFLGNYLATYVFASVLGIDPLLEMKEIFSMLRIQADSQMAQLWMPIIVGLTSLLEVALFLVFGFVFLKRLNIDYQKPKHFLLYQLPKWVSIATILLAMTFFIQIDRNSWLGLTIFYLRSSFLLLMGLQGFLSLTLACVILKIPTFFILLLPVLGVFISWGWTLIAVAFVSIGIIDCLTPIRQVLYAKLR